MSPLEMSLNKFGVLVQIQDNVMKLMERQKTAGKGKGTPATDEFWQFIASEGAKPVKSMLYLIEHPDAVHREIVDAR